MVFLARGTWALIETHITSACRTWKSLREGIGVELRRSFRSTTTRHDKRERMDCDASGYEIGTGDHRNMVCMYCSAVGLM